MSLDVTGVWDIECAEWDRFVCGEFLGVKGECFVSWDPDEFFDALIQREGVWYAHAGGTYDSLWLVDMACKRGLKWSAMLRGAGLLSVRIGKAEFRDSFALVPMSLEKAAPMGGAHKIGLALPDGYEGLSRKLNALERAAVEEYLHADCIALLAMLDALGKGCADKGIDLKLTVGGSAWASARGWLGLPKTKHTHARYKVIRQGYYGGRTEVFQSRAPAGQRYDIHSSYPAALSRVSLPFGEPKRLDARAASMAFGAGAEGIFSADVYVPKRLAIPPLPVRMPDRLLYPVGDITGVWTALELRRAIAAGAEVERVRWAYTFPESAPILAPFAERVWSYRAEAAARSQAKNDEGAAWAAWFKWLANSLTGKLAQRPEKESLRFEPISETGAPMLEERTERVLRSTKHGVFVIEETERIDACAHVEWSAYLTAEARCELGEQLRHAPTPLYCDTDSVYARETLTRRIGPELGEWGHEGSLERWEALAPKVYRYDCQGKTTVKGKGLSGLTSDGFDALARGESWQADRGVKGARTAMRTDGGETLFRRKLLNRGLHPVPGWIGGRAHHEDGTTSAVTVETYETRLTKKR